ncbi:potassium voltage-gated channel subfamily E member 3 [Pelobates fuscus]|uniref:potassium voltage-gated channel subfamily E member 3 n=1 Tax=Pelobates fuscus TaxID=191477 RepID=UPI002FE4A70F
MESPTPMERLLENLNSVLQALNKTLNSQPCQSDKHVNKTINNTKNDNSYIFILFVMFLFAVTVGSLILGYTRSKKVDKRSDPYHVYIKNNTKLSVI